MDLPKGGTEKGEDIEGTSRSREETGVNQLHYKKLQKTYHVFKRNGVYKLKLHTGSKCFLILREHLKGNLRKEHRKVAWVHLGYPRIAQKLL
jgi:ADP-ribose pyrophosphatase YjhB (NUDIX family)